VPIWVIGTRFDVGYRIIVPLENICGTKITFACFWLIQTRNALRSPDMLGTILLIILILLLLGALPNWGYSRGWGYGPSGGLGLVLVIIIILVLMGRI
jgi:hypothetical protein